MAKRIRSAYLTDTWRERIKTSMLINRLHEHVFGNIKLEATQLKAIEILLKKSAPDLASMQVSGDNENPLTIITKLYNFEGKDV
jgi:hypothetical protein